MTRLSPPTRDPISFGPFTLIASERLLTRNGIPVELGARTLDTLIVLVSRPNEVVTKREFLTQVWPDAVVEEASLRFHIAGLRKALGDGKNGARYVATLPGRGYCFVAPVSRLGSHNPATATPVRPRGNLPNRLLRMVGRDASVRKIAAELVATRFVTIVGPGGVGKTTVAVAIADDLTDTFAGATLFVDLGALSDPSLIAASIAAMLGLATQTDDPASRLVTHLREKRVLLILDTCEHLIEAVAPLAARLLLAGQQVHILATSREALRVEGEHVHRLQPLTVPPEDSALSANERLAFPATRLFMERAVASGADLPPNDANATLIAAICRKLDGIPLAIELAAGRVEAFGLQQTASLLEQRLALPWQGRRNAPPRQRTLQATLDWSFGLLSAPERAVLVQLSVFVGSFTLEAALSVVDLGGDQSIVVDSIDSLVAKSMVAVRPIGAMVRYQLLDVTRAYALSLSREETELAGVAARHAAYYRRWLEQRDTAWTAAPNTSERARCFAALHNVRAALHWCFGDDGNAELGIFLVCAAAPVFLAMSFVHECHQWCERALRALDDSRSGGAEEMRLQASLGMALMLVGGSNDAVLTALNRSLAIAENRGDVLAQLTLLGPLRMFHSRAGQFKAALGYAERSVALSRSLADPAAIALAHAMLGNSLFMTGELSGARAELEAALEPEPGIERSGATFFGFDSHVMAEITLAQVAWLQGDPADAERRARQSVLNAARTEHPVTLSVALVWTIAVFLGTGNFEAVREYVDRFVSNADAHALGPYLAVGRGFEGQLAICTGDAGSGVAGLEDCLKRLRAVRYELLTTPFNISLAQGLASMGREAEALALADENLLQIEARGDWVYKPELLRVKAGILRSMHRRGDAEMCLLQSLALSRDQGAVSWELRAALDLVALAIHEERPAAATIYLQPVLERFAPGSDTADLRAAEALLAGPGRGRRTMPPGATL